jgi:CBS domain-containing protein
VGVLTDRDVCMAAYTQGRRLAEIPVHTAMTARVQVVRESAGADEVLTLMSDKKIRRVPVVDDSGELKGVVGLADLARNAASSSAARKLADTLRSVTHARMI